MPDARLLAVAPVAPLLQAYAVAVPDVTVTLADPVLPLHPVGNTEVVIAGAPVLPTTALAVAEQPPVPVTVTVYVPPVRLLAVAPVAPLLQVYAVAVPDVTVTVALPLALEQVALVAVADTTKPPDEPTTVLAVAVQLLVEVTVTVYVPAASELIVCVLAPLLQLYADAVPPAMLAVAVPVLVQPAAVDVAEAVIPADEATLAVAVAVQPDADTVTV